MSQLHATSAAEEPAAHTGPSLESLQSLIADDLMRVNQVILDNVRSDVTLIGEVATYIVNSGGKRLRPALTLACAQLCGYEGDRHINLAACVEFIHTATLLHDDVVDASDLRRGNATANQIWGNQSSVLVGDFLFSRSFQLMVADGSLNVLKILSDAAATISEGEVQQLMTAQNPETNEATYLQVISGKTAALFAAATEIGAVVAGKPEWEAPLRQFGMSLGIAFQLVDDALDYSANQQELGKTIGDDFREGKITLPVILAYQQADEDERAFLHRTLEDMNQQPDDLDNMQALIERYNTLALTFERAHAFAEEARMALRSFPASPAKQALEEVIDFCVERAY